MIDWLQDFVLLRLVCNHILVIDKLTPLKFHLLSLLLFIAVHLLAEQPDTLASQSIVVSYKINSPALPPTALAEMFSQPFYHCQ